MCSGEKKRVAESLRDSGPYSRSACSTEGGTFVGGSKTRRSGGGSVEGGETNVSGSGGGTLGGGSAAMAFSEGGEGALDVSHQASAGGDGAGVSEGDLGFGAATGGESIHQDCARSGGITVVVGRFTSVRGGTVMSRSHSGQWICVPPLAVPIANSFSQ